MFQCLYPLTPTVPIDGCEFKLFRPHLHDVMVKINFAISSFEKVHAYQDLTDLIRNDKFDFGFVSVAEGDCNHVWPFMAIGVPLDANRSLSVGWRVRLSANEEGNRLL